MAMLTEGSLHVAFRSLLAVDSIDPRDRFPEACRAQGERAVPLLLEIAGPSRKTATHANAGRRTRRDRRTSASSH